MTPNELELVMRDGQDITDSPDAFAATFYDTLFEIAPETRPLFADDMTEQRVRLVGELLTLLTAATAWRSTGSLDGFVERAKQLGHRHLAYGVEAPMYEAVRVALLAAIGDTVSDFDDAHEAAWTKLYGLVADIMQEGATDA